MNKRTFLQLLLASGSAGLSAARYLQPSKLPVPASSLTPGTTAGSDLSLQSFPSILPGMADTSPEEELVLALLQENELNPTFQHQEDLTPDPAPIEQSVQLMPDQVIDNYLRKIRNFDADYLTDLYLDASRMPLLLSSLQRLEQVQNYMGHANFNLLSFDDLLFVARNYGSIGSFEKPELDFMEEIFYADATLYGFFGDKVTPDLTYRISEKDVEKILGSGHYLLKGESLNHYNQIRKDIGEHLELTSGVRNIVKQMHLFLSKASQSNGNLSKASRSLAPPGHSFHNAGDFDVGKVGLGELNFTSDFSRTDEFKRMITLGYVDIRYTDTNRFGVRYEPWHVKLGCSPEEGSTCSHA